MYDHLRIRRLPQVPDVQGWIFGSKSEADRQRAGTDGVESVGVGDDHYRRIFGVTSGGLGVFSSNGGG